MLCAQCSVQLLLLLLPRLSLEHAAAALVVLLGFCLFMHASVCPRSPATALPLQQVLWWLEQSWVLCCGSVGDAGRSSSSSCCRWLLTLQRAFWLVQAPLVAAGARWTLMTRTLTCIQA